MQNIKRGVTFLGTENQTVCFLVQFADENLSHAAAGSEKNRNKAPHVLTSLSAKLCLDLPTFKRHGSTPQTGGGLQQAYMEHLESR